MYNNHELKYSPTFEATFCIGSREGYHGPAFTREDVLDQINKFQNELPKSMPVKVSDAVTFTMKDYRETGWEISAITYPNNPSSRVEVENFMLGLATNLLYHFKQNRITLRFLQDYMDGDKSFHPSTIMLEMKSAEKSH